MHGTAVWLQATGMQWGSLRQTCKHCGRSVSKSADSASTTIWLGGVLANHAAKAHAQQSFHFPLRKGKKRCIQFLRLLKLPFNVIITVNTQCSLTIEIESYASCDLARPHLWRKFVPNKREGGSSFLIINCIIVLRSIILLFEKNHCTDLWLSRIAAY